jgi:UPF0716 protein FxsA
MLLRLLLFAILLAFAEVALFVWLAREAGVLPTIAVVLGTGFLGAILTRWQGFKAWRAVRADLDAGRMPAASLVDGMLTLLAGALLVLPGLITDACGLLLLVPAVRRAARGWLVRRFQRHVSVRFGNLASRAGFGRGEVIDAEFRRADAAALEHRTEP